MQALRPAPWQVSFVALGVIWGCSFLFIKLGLQSFTPAEVAFGRLAIGAAVLLLIGRATGSPLPRRRSVWRHLAVAALLFCSIPFTLFAWGETRVSSIVAGIINSITPLMVLAVVLAAYPEQRPGPERVVGLGVGFVGVLVVLGVWNGLGDGELVGVLACLGAVVCYGMGFPYVRRHLAASGEAPLAIATGQVLLGAIFLVPVVVVTALAGGGGVTTPIEPSTVVGMVALGALGSGIAYLMNTRILMQAGATIASSVTYITPLVAVVAGAALLGERLAWYQPVGGAMVLLGVAISQGRVRVARPGRHSSSLEADARG
jgi:drug/metabolite transporter (DMT)-like permease